MQKEMIIGGISLVLVGVLLWMNRSTPVTEPSSAPISPLPTAPLTPTPTQQEVAKTEIIQFAPEVGIAQDHLPIATCTPSQILQHPDVFECSLKSGDTSYDPCFLENELLVCEPDPVAGTSAAVVQFDTLPPAERATTHEPGSFFIELLGSIYCRKIAPQDIGTLTVHYSCTDGTWISQDLNTRDEKMTADIVSLDEKEASASGSPVRVPISKIWIY